MNVIPFKKAKKSNKGSRINNGPIAALDIGSHKICCLIAKTRTSRHKGFSGKEQNELEIIGAGQHEAAGIRAGAIIDMEKAERAIRGAVAAAERAADITIEDVYVNVSGGGPKSRRYSAKSDIAGEVSVGDMQNVLMKARSAVDTGNQAVLHAAPLEYKLDGASGLRDPQGMFGDQLGAELSVTTVNSGPMRNLVQCINRCHLRVAGFVLAPFAAGLSVLADDEMELGATLIEMGASTTSVAVFADNNLVYADVTPIGGRAVTNDIARGLSTPLAHAERMKTLHGSALASLSDDREMISVPLIGERGRDGVNKMPRSMLIGIIQPRLEEIFEMARDRLEASGFAAHAGRRIVLSGGASQMVGARELAASLFDRKVRLAEPRPISGLPDYAKNAGFATTIGLLFYGQNPSAYSAVKPDLSDMQVDMQSNYLARVGRWLKQGF